jgi:hypothetical protein
MGQVRQFAKWVAAVTRTWKGIVSLAVAVLVPAGSWIYAEATAPAPVGVETRILATPAESDDETFTSAVILTNFNVTDMPISGYFCSKGIVVDIHTIPMSLDIRNFGHCVHFTRSTVNTIAPQSSVAIVVQSTHPDIDVVGISNALGRAARVAPIGPWFGPVGYEIMDVVDRAELGDPASTFLRLVVGRNTSRQTSEPFSGAFCASGKISSWRTFPEWLPARSSSNCITLPWAETNRIPGSGAFIVLLEAEHPNVDVKIDLGGVRADKAATMPPVHPLLALPVFFFTLAKMNEDIGPRRGVR